MARTDVPDDDYRWCGAEEPVACPADDTPARRWWYAELCERGTERVVGAAWFRVDVDVLRVVYRLDAALGSTASARYWIAVRLLGVEGLVGAAYEGETLAIVARDLDRDGVEAWSWRDTRPLPERDVEP